MKEFNKMERRKLNTFSSRSSAVSEVRRGAILPLVAVTMVAMMGILLLTIDGGLMQRERRIAQLAADAAAKAGAIELLRERTDLVVTSARADASRNGFTHGSLRRSVIVTYPSTDPGFSGPNFLQVAVADTVQTLFGRIIGRQSVAVNARAVGGVTGTTQNCITSLNETARHSLLVSSGGQVETAPGCTVSVNSNHSQALCVTASNGGYLRADVSVTGNRDTGCTGPITGNVVTGAPRVADPLAATAALQVSDTSGPCRGGVYDLFVVTTDITLNPGNYCGGIKAGKSSSVARLNPGVYVIKGGGFSVGGGGTVIGNGGVTVINLKPPIGSGGSFEVIDFGSDANVSMSAPTSGRIAGVLFYTPRGQGPPSENQITSSSTATLNGSLYFPDQSLGVGSGGTLTINGGIVADIIEFRSDSRVNIAGFAGASAYGLKQASIVK